jgi:hypothetical protein
LIFNGFFILVGQNLTHFTPFYHLW